MKQLIKSRIFIGTFLVIYFAFFVVTVFILEVKEEGLFAGYMEYGFPFTYYHTTCFGAFYSWSGLIGNMLFAAIISFFGGLIASYFLTKFSSPELKLAEFRVKWHI